MNTNLKITIPEHVENKDSTVLNVLREYFTHYDQRSIDDIRAFYSDDIKFIDPVHHIQGIEKVVDYFKAMNTGLSYCRFEFVHQTVSGEDAWLKWIMHYSHPKIQKGKPLSLEGTSHLRFNEKVYSHQDFYDMGAMLYEHIPVLGAGVRWIKGRLGQ